MVGINSVTIIGNIGTISDIMTTNNGAKFVNITVATTETYYSSNNEKKSNTQWHNVILWNNMTELQKMLSKGDQIFTEIVAKNVRVLNRKNYSSDEKKRDFSFDSSIDISRINIEEMNPINFDSNE